LLPASCFLIVIFVSRIGRASIREIYFERTILRFVEIAILGVALGCDAFAVGMGVGARFCRPRQTFRLSFHFGLFQFIMPILGWFVSQRLPGTGRVWGPWIAFALLFLIGAKMVVESLLGKKADPAECADPTRGLSLVILSVAASLDAFGVGFSLGILGAGLITPAVWFGVTAGVMTWVAMKLGSRLSTKFGRWVEAAGGLILMLLAIEFVA
jgi:putative Mn2+ efflux pump MntP